MSSLSSSFRCAKHRRDARSDTEAWAKAFVGRRPRSVEDARHQVIVADLLAQIGASR